LASMPAKGRCHCSKSEGNDNASVNDVTPKWLTVLGIASTPVHMWQWWSGDKHMHDE